MTDRNSPAERFEALTFVSPSCCGGEPKDQDRAIWYPSTQVGTVADGVTASPHSDLAADLVCQLSPVLFTGHLSDRLAAICAALVAKRVEASESEVHLAPDTPEAVKPFLREAAQARLSQAFQTTFVAVCLTSTDDGTLVDLCACGDAGFFAFSPHGELLYAYPDFGESTDAASDSIGSPEAMTFGPGDNLLVKIIERVSDRPQLAGHTGIHPGNASNWLICRPLDHCGTIITTGRSPSERKTQVTTRDELIAPRHLIGKAYEREPGGYCRLPYSRLIKRIASPPNHVTFDGKGTVTAVLPDHFPSRWTHRQERFNRNTQFLLCSDGLYEAFRDPGELWAWLSANEVALSDSAARKPVLADLHARRHSERGDDDISLVWIKASAADTDEKEQRDE